MNLWSKIHADILVPFDAHHGVSWSPLFVLTMSLFLLRGWISLVAVAAIGNSIQCLLNENYPRERIYLLAADNGIIYNYRSWCTICIIATPLVTRVFGTWTLLAAIIRLAFVFSPRNQRYDDHLVLTFKFSNFLFSPVFI